MQLCEHEKADRLWAWRLWRQQQTGERNGSFVVVDSYESMKQQREPHKHLDSQREATTEGS